MGEGGGGLGVTCEEGGEGMEERAWNRDHPAKCVLSLFFHDSNILFHLSSTLGAPEMYLGWSELMKSVGRQKCSAETTFGQLSAQN